MATKRSQKVFIWVIAVTMLIGSVGTYFLMILANDNASRDAAQRQEEIARMQEEYEEQQRRMQLPAEPLVGYAATPFDAASVTALTTNDVRQGEGAEVQATSTIRANYFGWLADGTIFDSTNRGGEVEPLEFSLQGVIEGWTEGLTGARQGSIRELTIPAELAYRDEATGGIPANSPLKFIVEIVEVVE